MKTALENANSTYEHWKTELAAEKLKVATPSATAMTNAKGDVDALTTDYNQKNGTYLAKKAEADTARAKAAVLKAEVDRIKLLITNSNNAKDEATVTWTSELTAVKDAAGLAKTKYGEFWTALQAMDAKRSTFTGTGTADTLCKTAQKNANKVGAGTTKDLCQAECAKVQYLSIMTTFL